MSVPRILYPKGGESLTGTIQINCLPAIDTFSHTITYILYFSDDAGKSWNLITILHDPIRTYSYNWRTTTLPDGNNYLIKVVANCTNGRLTEFITLEVFSINKSRNNNSTIGFSIVYLIVALTYLLYYNRKWK